MAMIASTPVGERLDLPVHVGAAVDGDHAAADGLGQRREDVVDLQRQLAGGHEHEAPRLARLGGLEAREHRQPEREGLAGAGLGLAAHVAAGEGVGDGEPLDGEGLGDALVGQDLHEEGRDAEVFEGEVVALGGRLRDVGVVHEFLDNVTGAVSAAPHPLRPGGPP